MCKNQSENLEILRDYSKRRMFNMQSKKLCIHKAYSKTEFLRPPWLSNKVIYSNPRFHWIQSETDKKGMHSLTIVNIHKASSPTSAKKSTTLHYDINPSDKFNIFIFKNASNPRTIQHIDV
jgi:hypothetical protein